jgi:hypothetical protein
MAVKPVNYLERVIWRIMQLKMVFSRQLSDFPNYRIRISRNDTNRPGIGCDNLSQYAI